MTLPESAYRDLFAAQYRGKIEVRVPLGRIDVLTTDYAVEVEPYGTWRHGARQALGYGEQVRQQAALAIYGDIDWKACPAVHLHLRGLLKLFVLSDTKWCPVTPDFLDAGPRPLADDDEILAAIVAAKVPRKRRPNHYWGKPYETPEEVAAAMRRAMEAMDRALAGLGVE